MINLNYKNQRGFATLEIMIAMVVILMALGATLLVSSGGQSILIDSRTDAEALTVTQQALENMQSLARKDFKLINSNTLTNTLTGTVYTTVITVTTQPDFFTKQITATTTWPGTFGRNPSVSLTALVTNFENGVGGDTCDSNLTGDWTNASIKNSVSTLDPVTDIDAYQNKLYVTTNNSGASHPTFHVFTINNNKTLTLQDEVDNDNANNTGLNGVAVATNNFGSYAYVASASSFTKGQLQIIDLNNLHNTPVTYKIPTTIVTGTSTQGVGNTIFYNNGYVYLGLTKPTSGPEFNIIDVHNPLAPVWVGGYTVGNAVNAIYVNNTYAYITTPNSEELTIVNIGNPTNPQRVSGFDAPLGSGNGKSVNSVGDTIYLGRNVGGKEFYILDDKSGTPNSLGSYDVNQSITGLIVRNYLSFLLTTTQLQILRTDSPASITPYTSPINIPTGFGNGTSMDCEGNNIFIGTDNGHISLISTP